MCVDAHLGSLCLTSLCYALNRCMIQFVINRSFMLFFGDSDLPVCANNASRCASCGCSHSNFSSWNVDNEAGLVPGMSFLPSGCILTGMNQVLIDLGHCLHLCIMCFLEVKVLAPRLLGLLSIPHAVVPVDCTTARCPCLAGNLGAGGDPGVGVVSGFLQ